jgi:hypothetical protein
MSNYRVPMWQQNTKMLLGEVLSKISFACEPTWLLHEFSGTGVAPNGLGMVEFETCIRESGPARFDTASLTNFASALTDVYDLRITAWSGHKIAEIVGFDSECWDIWLDDSLAKYR